MSENVEVMEPEKAEQDTKIPEAQRKALTALEMAKAVVITSNETYEAAFETIRAFKDLKKEINSAFEPIVSAAHKAHVAAKEQQNKAIKPIDDAVEIIKSAASKYLLAVEQKQKEEEEHRKELERKEREKLLQKTQKELEKIGAECQSIEDEIIAVGRLLESPEVSDAEKGVYNDRLATLRALLEEKQDRAAAKSAATEERLSMPSSVPFTPQTAMPKATGGIQ